MAAQRVAAEHEIDAAAHRPAQRLHALGARVDAVVQRQHDVPRALRAQLRRVRGHDLRGVTAGRLLRMHLRHGGQRHADHADGGQHPRRGETERQVRGEQRERQLAPPPAQVVLAPVELVVAGDGHVDRQLAQGQERPHAVAERAERAALGEVAGVDPERAARLLAQVVDGRPERGGARSAP